MKALLSILLICGLSGQDITDTTGANIIFYIDTSQDTTIDTTHILVFFPVNVELMIPLHYQNKDFKVEWGRDIAYNEFNIMMFQHVYMIETKSNYNMWIPTITVKYYDMDWNEIELPSSFLVYDYEIWRYKIEEKQ